MRRILPLLVTLVCAWNTACRAPRPASDDGGAPPGDAGDAPEFWPTYRRKAQQPEGGVEAGASASPRRSRRAEPAAVKDTRSRAELLEIFLEAARSNVERPYPAGQRGSRVRYRDAATALLGEDRLNASRGAVNHVARVLARVEEEQARQALMAWALMPAAREHLPDILSHMAQRPRAEYLATCKALLDEPALASVIDHSFELDSGLLGEALGMMLAATSMRAMVLATALYLPTPDGPALVRRYAMDRAHSAPDPRTLRALKCRPGQVRVEEEAQAVASLRILMLSLLRDRALLTTVAADPTDSPLVRHWARRMLRGRLDRSVDWRARRNEELSMIEFVGPDNVPCLTVKPESRYPERDE